MKKLSASQIKRRETIVGHLRDAMEQYSAAVTEFNGFIEEIKDEMDTYYDERSEKWQDSEAGDTYVTWMSEWDIPELDEPDTTLVDDFENAPTEPGS